MLNNICYIYTVLTSVVLHNPMHEDVPLAVNKFAACVADINAWLSTCRLRLNGAKTQLLWLGSSQLVDRVDCHDVLLLGTRVAISDTARDLVLS